jgi:hypothetical protein
VGIIGIIGVNSIYCEVGCSFQTRTTEEGKRGQVRFFLASDPYGADSVPYGYDSLDDLTRTTDAYGNSASLAYDTAGDVKGGKGVGSRYFTPSWLSFLGRPGGRSVVSRPNRLAVCSTHDASPKGHPRTTDRRNASNSPPGKNKEDAARDADHFR